MVRWILKTMGQGLVAMIPIGATLGIILLLGMWLERMFANPLKGLFPGSSEVYRMGMGIASFLILMFLCGLLVKLWLVRRILDWIEGRLMQLPLVKTLYGALKDVMNFVGGGKNGKKTGDMVVMVTTKEGWRQIGIVTRQDFDELPPELLGDKIDLIAVFVPFSYQLGGFTYFIERERCEPVPGMSVEDAMRYAMMAWLGSSSGRETSGKALPAPDAATAAPPGESVS